MQEIELLVPFKYLFFSFFLLVSSNSFAQVYPIAEVDSLLRKGTDEIVNQQYDLAKEDFITLNKNFPDIPLGKIYLAAVEIAKDYDYAVDFNSDYISSYLDEAKRQSQKLVEENNNAWNYYFLALSEGYFAYFQALNKNWVSALSNGLNSISDFEKCLNLNPKFYDAYTAIGTFKYWRSRKIEFLNWLPLVDNEEKEGINYLLMAVNHIFYNKYLAVNSLFWIYIDKKEYKKASVLVQKVLKDYPNSRLFKWDLARAYEGIDHKKSIILYDEVLSSYKNEPTFNGYYEVVIKHINAMQYHDIGEDQKALKLCKEILSMKNLSESVIKRLGKRLDRVKKLEKDLSK